MLSTSSFIIWYFIWEEFKWLRENGKLMYSYFGALNSEFKLFCYNDGKRAGNDLKETIKRSLTDPFNKLTLSRVCVSTAVYNTFLRLMWGAVYAVAEEKGLLKRIAKSAVRYDIAQWV